MVVLKRIIGIILSLFLIMFVSVFVYFMYCQLNKAYWDRKVVELCKKDGGVIVYQTVELTEDEYKRFGGVNGTIPVPGEDSSATRRYEYLSKMNITYINEINPTVMRIKYIIYRKSDRKILGKRISYLRRGGDLPIGIGHDTSFSCSQVDGFEKSLQKGIFSLVRE